MDSEYTLVVDVIDVIASAKSKMLFTVAGTSGFVPGGVKLYEYPTDSALESDLQEKRTLVRRSAGSEG